MDLQHAGEVGRCASCAENTASLRSKTPKDASKAHVFTVSLVWSGAKKLASYPRAVTSLRETTL